MFWGVWRVHTVFVEGAEGVEGGGSCEELAREAAVLGARFNSTSQES